MENEFLIRFLLANYRKKCYPITSGKLEFDAKEGNQMAKDKGKDKDKKKKEKKKDKK